MARLIALLGFALLCGCNRSGDVIHPQRSRSNEPAVAPAASAFCLDETKQVISLDTRIAPQQRRRFDIGLGSITLETLKVTDNMLTFLYTPEVEGGYTIYECTVPISPTPVEIKIDSDGTPGATSFDLTECNVIGNGNATAHPPSQPFRVPAENEIARVNPDLVGLGPSDYFKEFKIEEGDLLKILRDYHVIPERDWLHNYSHVAFGDRTGTITLRTGTKIKYMVRPGGLASLTFPDGRKLFLADLGGSRK